jgi:DNA-directed RNA polymerase sigma subunit (sigma70/sigma32)
MKNKKLKIIQTNETCYNLHERHSVSCNKKSCNSWINYSESKNCAIIASKSGPKTLQEIGKIYGLTRMRICQIEKNIYEKIKNIIQNNL